jgi:hypothetical protein
VLGVSKAKLVSDRYWRRGSNCYASSTLLNIWILSCDYHALLNDPLHLFDANIFYPLKRTLAFSEHMLPNILLFWPVLAVTRNPVSAYNVTLLASFFLSALFMFLLCHYWTRQLVPAVIGGIVFAFAPIRFAQIGHFQLLGIYWTPLVFLELDKGLRSRRFRHFVLAGLFYTLQTLTSLYLGLMLTVLLACYLLVHIAFVDRRILSRDMVIRGLSVALLSFLVVSPFSYPYLRVRSKFRFMRSIGESIGHSADFPSSFFATSWLMSSLENLRPAEGGTASNPERTL